MSRTCSTLARWKGIGKAVGIDGRRYLRATGTYKVLEKKFSEWNHLHRFRPENLFKAAIKRNGGGVCIGDFIHYFPEDGYREAMQDGLTKIAQHIFNHSYTSWAFTWVWKRKENPFFLMETDKQTNKKSTINIESYTNRTKTAIRIVRACLWENHWSRLLPAQVPSSAFSRPIIITARFIVGSQVKSIHPLLLDYDHFHLLISSFQGWI